nr:helix-turn-helix domain-containing protein [Streptomyces akebiae]
MFSRLTNAFSPLCGIRTEARRTVARPERPLDPAAGPVPRLAHELRELRRAAGSPSYRTMADAAGFSAAALSRAASGTRLPSLAVVQGYARACGGDPGEWEPRWKRAETEAAGRRSTTPGTRRRRTGGCPVSSRTTATCSSAGTSWRRSCGSWCAATGSRSCSGRPAAASPRCCGPG